MVSDIGFLCNLPSLYSFVEIHAYESPEISSGFLNGTTVFLSVIYSPLLDFFGERI
jgi:hypothetical protein